MAKLSVTALLILVLAASPAGASETLKGLQKDFAVLKTKVSAEVGTAREKLDAEIAAAKGEKNGFWKKFKRTLSDSLDALNSKLQNALKD